MRGGRHLRKRMHTIKSGADSDCSWHESERDCKLDRTNRVVSRHAGDVIFNIATDTDLTNRTRGEIEEIILDLGGAELMEDEETGFTYLHYPPVMVMF